MIFLGLDIGSSFIKASLYDADNGQSLCSESYPNQEMQILSPKADWAEQDPEIWFDHVAHLLLLLKGKFKGSLKDVRAIGISYQMHGLVILDKTGKPVRNSIIWCDSRAVNIGDKAFAEIGHDYCLNQLLNSPGNFTASKLKWVQEFEPDNYRKIYKVMLPGDYIAYRLTDEISTTHSGLSEGVLWDFSRNTISEKLLNHFGIENELLPEACPAFSVQGQLTKNMAEKFGLTNGIPVSYRAGDQPNNAFSLNVLHPGEIAATAGTSGVVYGVTEAITPDPSSRVNTFLHVNHSGKANRLGVLLCINGTGILNSWVKHNLLPKNTEYENMNSMAETVKPGSEGLMVFPFGNGAERVLGNKDIKSRISGLDLNKHKTAHIIRAAQEGIVFAMVYGIEVMKELGLKMDKIRAAHANLFQSAVFRQTLASLSMAQIEMYNTDGALGAARGAAVGIGYQDITEVFQTLELVKKTEPEKSTRLEEAYFSWKQELEKIISNH